MCCCSDSSCGGPSNNQQEMLCRNHCEDLSNEINLTNQNTNTKSLQSLSAKINFKFIKIDHRNTEISQK